ncbi:hypothetical protein [Azospirillum sp.]|uniref:hypothetical protein n=1 Tax=Azospirillum sp. TaxID=34012 RepID=UPI003D7135CD
MNELQNDPRIIRAASSYQGGAFSTALTLLKAVLIEWPECPEVIQFFGACLAKNDSTVPDALRWGGRAQRLAPGLPGSADNVAVLRTLTAEGVEKALADGRTDAALAGFAALLGTERAAGHDGPVGKALAAMLGTARSAMLEFGGNTAAESLLRAMVVAAPAEPAVLYRLSILANRASCPAEAIELMRWARAAAADALWLYQPAQDTYWWSVCQAVEAGTAASPRLAAALGAGKPDGAVIPHGLVPQLPLRRARRAASGRELPPRWAIIPGAVRAPSEVRSMVGRAVRLRSQGLLDGIVLSTWNGHVSGNPDLRGFLDSQDVRWVETRPPRIRIPGNIVQQMVTLSQALEHCPDGALILKIRTDKVTDYLLDHCSVPYLRRPDLLRLAPGDAIPGVNLSGRIAVPEACLLRPFNYTDLVFAGFKQDLLKLVNFDLRYLLVFRNVDAEQWFFSHPFIDRFKIFQWMFAEQSGITLEGSALWNLLADLLNNDFFMELIAVQLSLVDSYFRVGPLDHNPAFQKAVAGVVRRSTFREIVFGSALFNRLTVFQTAAWIPPLLRGELRPDPLGTRFADALERVAGPERRFDPGGWDEASVRARPAFQDFVAINQRHMERWRGTIPAWETRRDDIDLSDYLVKI